MNIPEYENYKEIKSHYDPLFPYNTYLCSIPLDFYDVPLHWHNEMEIIYVKKGKGRVTIDFQLYNIEAGDIVILLSGQLHAISQLGSYTMEYENIIFSTDMLLSKYGDSLNSDFFVPFLAGNIYYESIVTSSHPMYPELSSCLNRADKVCSTFEKGYKLAIKGFLFEFFYVIFHNSEDTVVEKYSKHLNKIKEVLKYIETHYHDPITIEEIAGVCGYSPSHFMRFFKNALGTSFIDYLNDYRLLMASRMLMSSDENILNIATDCGYDNLSYFNRIFKRRYGMPPSHYRNNNVVKQDEPATSELAVHFTCHE